jgi:serine/threonine protein kinase
MASSTFEPGHIIAGRYRVERLLGQGAMGSVYRALQLSVGRSVALKLLVDEHTGDPAHVERFEREALALSRLAHPNTVRLFDFGTSERGCPFIVMELLRGSDLADDLERHGPLRWDQALRVMHGVASSLAEAHAMGIVHRDIKPANIFLCADTEWPTVKVLDFGIAGDTARNAAPKLTLTGTVVGSAAYMSPEQAQGKTVGPASDLYGLGVVSFEALTARTPFQGRAFTAQLLAKVLEPAPRLRELSPEPDVPAEVAALVEQLLERDPSRRPASAAALIGRIEELLARAPRRPPERVVLASPRLPPPGVAKTEPMLVARTIDEGWSPPRTGVVASIPRDRDSRRPRRSRWPLAAPSVGVLGLALVGAPSALSPELEASRAATTIIASNVSVARSAPATSTAGEASAALLAVPSNVEVNALGSSTEEALADSTSGTEWVRFEETPALQRDAARLPEETSARDEPAAPPEGRAEAAASNARVARPSRAPGARKPQRAPRAVPEPAAQPSAPEATASREASALPAPAVTVQPREASALPAPAVTVEPGGASALPAPAVTVEPRGVSRPVVLPESTALPAPPPSAPRGASRPVVLPESTALPAPPPSAPREPSPSIATAEPPPLASAAASPAGTALPELGPLPAPGGISAPAPASVADRSTLPAAHAPRTDPWAPPLEAATPPVGAAPPEGAASAESEPPSMAPATGAQRYPSVMAVRAALASGAITPLQRNRIVARLRERRYEARARAARDYQAGWISRRELRARQRAIEREFEGY